MQLVGVLTRRIGGQRVALPGVERRLRDRIEVGVVARQAGEVGPIAEFAAEHRLAELVLVVDHRMDDRKLALHVGRRQAVEVHRARVEIAALAAAGEIELRDGFEPAGLERVHQGEIGPQAVVLQDDLVGDDGAVPAPDPVVVQANWPVVSMLPRKSRSPGSFGRAGSRTASASSLEDAGGLDRVGAVHQPVAPFALQQQALPRRSASASA